MEFIKKMNYITKFLKKQLRKVAVKSDSLILYRLYKFYTINGKNECLTRLYKGNPLNW